MALSHTHGMFGFIQRPRCGQAAAACSQSEFAGGSRSWAPTTTLWSSVPNSCFGHPSRRTLCPSQAPMSVSTTRRAHVARWSPMFPSCLMYPARSFARRVLQQTRTAWFRLLGLIEEIVHEEKFDVICEEAHRRRWGSNHIPRQWYDFERR